MAVGLAADWGEYSAPGSVSWKVQAKVVALGLEKGMASTEKGSEREKRYRSSVARI